MQKIPCSVSIITLNSDRDLPRALELVKHFAEVIVSDGNSTDTTRDVARAAGAKVMSQYDTDEPNTRCVMDKAAVRQRAFDASTYDWRLFLDSDDTFSEGGIEEIRRIVTDSHPPYLGYRFPTYVVVDDGQRFHHAASEPGYQVRLVHKSVGARFKGHVHERLVFDGTKFPIGTARSAYEFHWDTERFKNFGSFLKRYAEWEVYSDSFPTLSSYFRWAVFFRIKAFLGYALSVVRAYVKWGREGTMPLRIEFAWLWYHVSIFVGAFWKAFSRSLPVDFLVECLRGKDSYRFFSNRTLLNHEAYGRIIDIGGGKKRGSHYRYLTFRRWHRVVTVDIDPKEQPDIVADIATEKLPLVDGYANTVFLMNVLEHVSDVGVTLRETHRILAKDGIAYAVVPFLVNVHPTPADFRRMTRQGLQKEFERAGFTCDTILPFGTGPFLAGYYQIDSLVPRFLRIVTVPSVCLLDVLLHLVRPRLFSKEKFPLGYLVIARRI
ncbi:methyltransferase domain-containing protein [Patescibacteria group bacterium]|nr:methyltransferase domain-containing protein [Patescibacteria group bacterium]